MAAERIQTGDTEPITLDVRDSTGSPLTGAVDIGVRVRRVSDGEYLDWDDLTFKSSGWTELDRIAAEQDATLAPGFYAVTGGLDTLGITNATQDDTYTILPTQGSAIGLPGLPPPGELKVGQWVDAVGLELVCSATIGSAVTDTMRVAAWLVRSGVPVTTGLVSAVMSFETAGGAIVVAASGMAGPSSRGIFTRDIPGLSLATVTNYVSVVTITDARGAVLRYQAQPTIG